MKVFKNPRMVYVDVDETLIFWEEPPKGINTIDVWIRTRKYQLNQRLIEKMIQLHNAGYGLIVWSTAGAEWAEEVVKRANLDSFVEACIAKPIFYVDDAPVERWMKTRIAPHFPPLAEPEKL